MTRGGEPRRGKAEPPVIFRAAYDLVLSVYRVVPGFPKSQRFVLGQRLEGEAVDLLAALIEANLTRDKASALERASLGLERLRIFLRLAKDLSFLDFTRYEELTTRTDEIGRMLGGWLKWAEGHAPEP